ncbi:spermidine/putrescine ABC transporter substrate-binding protein PotD, partial [Escherichia coli]|nr:spermidine/putrescine ABC transporter substrate-binding protein PotD [Escherichia coli]
AFVPRQAGTPIDVESPDEGRICWMDGLAIPAKANNIGNALALTTFLLPHDAATPIAENIGYPPPNPATRKLLIPYGANDKT